MYTLRTQDDAVRFFLDIVWPCYRGEPVEVSPVEVKPGSSRAGIYWSLERGAFQIPLAGHFWVDASLFVLFHELGHVENGDVQPGEAKPDEARERRPDPAKLLWALSHLGQKELSQEETWNEIRADAWARAELDHWMGQLRAVEDILDGLSGLDEEIKRNMAWKAIASAGELFEAHQRYIKAQAVAVHLKELMQDNDGREDKLSECLDAAREYEAMCWEAWRNLIVREV